MVLPVLPAMLSIYLILTHSATRLNFSDTFVPISNSCGTSGQTSFKAGVELTGVVQSTSSSFKDTRLFFKIKPNWKCKLAQSGWTQI